MWQALGNLPRNPLFRLELRRRTRRFWLVGLPLTSGVYALGFVLSLAFDWISRPVGADIVLSSRFSYVPWLAGAAALLALMAHLLVPVCVMGALGHRWELDSLRALHQTPLPYHEGLFGQTAAGAAPLAAGIAPLGLFVVGLLTVSSGAALSFVGVLVAALLWGLMCVCVSVWAAVATNSVDSAVLTSYALITLVLPVVVFGTSLALASGAEAGQSTLGLPFWGGAILTFGALTLGLAAGYWDAALNRIVPGRQRRLWDDAPVQPLPGE